MGLFDSLFGGDDAEKVEAQTVPTIDPAEIIRADAQANRLDQFTPFGNLTFSGPNRNRVNFKLTPQFQNLLNQNVGFSADSAALGRGLLSAVPESGDAATQALLQRMQPRLSQQEAAIRERFEQAGNPAAFGSAAMGEGAFNELALFNQQRNDMELAAYLAAPQYQGSLINNAIGAASGQTIGVPQFQFNTGSPVNALGAYNLSTGINQFNAGQMQNANTFNAQVQADRNSGMLGGLFDLGASFLGNSSFKIPGLS